MRLDKPWAGSDVTFVGPGELVLESDFTLIRVLNVDCVGIISSAANYPSWDEVVQLAMSAPYAEDETLIGADFSSIEAVSAWLWPQAGSYQLLECGYDRHVQTSPAFGETRQEAISCWERQVVPLSGTSGALLLEVLLGFEESELVILARKILGTGLVISDDRYY